jgi:hypothetical protein
MEQYDHHSIKVNEGHTSFVKVLDEAESVIHANFSGIRNGPKTGLAATSLNNDAQIGDPSNLGNDANGVKPTYQPLYYQYLAEGIDLAKDLVFVWGVNRTFTNQQRAEVRYRYRMALISNFKYWRSVYKKAYDDETPTTLPIDTN